MFENQRPDKIKRTLYKFDLKEDELGNCRGESVEEKTVTESVKEINGKDMFLAAASFSSSVPRSENIGLSEFKRSTYITFYYRSIESHSVKNYPQKVE
mgnify:CR=1 FL=1